MTLGRLHLRWYCVLQGKYTDKVYYFCIQFPTDCTDVRIICAHTFAYFRPILAAHAVVITVPLIVWVVCMSVYNDGVLVLRLNTQNGPSWFLV